MSTISRGIVLIVIVAEVQDLEAQRFSVMRASGPPGVDAHGAASGWVTHSPTTDSWVPPANPHRRSTAPLCSHAATARLTTSFASARGTARHGDDIVIRNVMHRMAPTSCSLA